MALIGAQAERELNGWVEALVAALAAVTLGGTAGLTALRTLTRGRSITRASTIDDISGTLTQFEQSYVAGKLAGVIGTNNVRRMTVRQLADAISGSQAAILTDSDRGILDGLKRGSERSLRARLGTTTARIDQAVGVANREWEGALRSGRAGQTAAAREGARRGALSILGEQVGVELAQTAFQQERFVQTELSRYMQEGTVANASGNEVVYKIPRSNAEAQCMRLHLNSDGSPIRYRLENVIGNSNMGVPPFGWTFTIGPVHPYCYCILHRETVDPRPGPNKKLAEGRENVLGGTLFPSGRTAQRPFRPPASAARRLGDRVVPASRAQLQAQQALRVRLRGVTNRGSVASEVVAGRPKVRIGKRSVRIGGAADPGPARRLTSQMPSSGDLTTAQRRTSRGISDEFAGKPKAKQRHADLDRLYDEAAVADAGLRRTVADLADELGGQAVFPPGGLKGRARVIEKANTKYGGDFAAITDFSRASLRFDRVDDVYRALDALGKSSKLKIVRMNDRFLNPTAEGYRDIILGVRLPNGHVAELQLHVGGILDVKEAKHLLYERQRSIVAQAKSAGRDLTAVERLQLDDLVAQQQSAYGTAFREATL